MKPSLLLDPNEIEELIDAALQKIHFPRAKWDDLLQSPGNDSPPWPGEQAKFTKASDLAPYIDHTLLKPDATLDAVAKLCEEARQWSFASVCVNSCHVSACVDHLNGASPRICAVAGFPLGAMVTSAKAREAWNIVQEGGHEIDTVMNIGMLKSGKLSYVYDDIAAIVEAADGRPVKVILETGYLSPAEVVTASVLSIAGGAAFVKTSTGFGPGVATTENITLMRHVVGLNRGVKASGGVRDTQAAIQMIQSGANRIGTSSGVAIVTGSMSDATY